VIHIEKDIERDYRILSEIILNCYLRDLKEGKLKDFEKNILKIDRR